MSLVTGLPGQQHSRINFAAGVEAVAANPLVGQTRIKSEI